MSKAALFLATALTSTAAMAQQTLPGQLMPPGPLHVVGSQIVAQDGTPVRLVCVGWNGTNGIGGHPDGWGQKPLEAHLLTMLVSGFNCIRESYSDAGIEEALGYIKQVVAAAGPLGLRVVIAHHSNEGADASGGWTCLAQQQNGLWFDAGPGTNGQNGCGNQGTVTAEKFTQNWVRIATTFAGDPTVIGFDLHNEPLAIQGKINWGQGGPTDIHAMCTATGNAIQAVNAEALVICEGPQNYSGSFAGGGPAPEGDLSAVGAKPVVLKVPGKVVYSVHEYPSEISGINGVTSESGQTAVARMNAAWGYLYPDLAPVWVGEMGSSMVSDGARAWADTLVSYLNGQAPGGLVVPQGGQGPGIDWWTWGNLDGQAPNGTLQGDWVTARPEQAAVYGKLLPKGAATLGTFATNPDYAAQLKAASQRAFPNAAATSAATADAVLAQAQRELDQMPLPSVPWFGDQSTAKPAQVAQQSPVDPFAGSFVSQPSLPTASVAGSPQPTQSAHTTVAKPLTSKAVQATGHPALVPTLPQVTFNQPDTAAPASPPAQTADPMAQFQQQMAAMQVQEDAMRQQITALEAQVFGGMPPAIARPDPPWANKPHRRGDNDHDADDD